MRWQGDVMKMSGAHVQVFTNQPRMDRDPSGLLVGRRLSGAEVLFDPDEIRLVTWTPRRDTSALPLEGGR